MHPVVSDCHLMALQHRGNGGVEISAGSCLKKGPFVHLHIAEWIVLVKFPAVL